ncbi:MAG: class I SAM-dependent methyltransferase [Vicinamibacterales bacterium]
MVFRLRRMRPMDPLQVAMTGVRMGERVLQIACDDKVLLSGVASKVGLSGTAALAVTDAEQAARGRAAAAKAGILLDLHVGPLDALAFESGAFDMVVIDDTRGRLADLDPVARDACLREAWRVLRPGGRVEVIERVGGGWFGNRATVSGDYAAGGGAEAALARAGFAPVRQLIEKDGFRFVEGLRA